MPNYTPLGDAGLKTAPPMPPAAPQGGSDIVSQMKSYLQSTGYKAPPIAPTPGANDWYSQVQNERKTTSDASFGGFGKVAGAIGDTFNSRADEVGKIENSSDNLLSKGLQIAGQGFGAVNDVAGDVIKTAIKPEVLQSFGEHLAPLVQSAAQTKAGQGVINWWQGLKPETQRNLSATGEIASLLSNAVGAGAAEKGAVTVAKVAEDAIPAATDAIKTGAKEVTSDIAIPGKEAMQKAAAEGKVPFVEGMSEQAKTSAQRMSENMPLIGAGAAREAKPIDAYNSFAQQESKHLADIKEDPAISLVGQRIGDAFDQVVKQRQEVGKTMSSELEKTATKSVAVGDALEKFSKELADNGATLHRTEKGMDILPSQTSKFASADEKILKYYANELDKLGKNPTMAQVDALVSRVPKEVEGLKSSANITFKTNAERLINNNLSDMRSALEKSGTTAYADARKQYSELSDFINEGAKHLGKTTQSGDYAKDASIAKSAVQSVLNNGKKDWLIELENKTGYPALDQSTLALQAMQDAGDYKGESLLKLLSEDAVKGGTPHGAIVNALTGLAKKTVGKAIIGSKADQTRAFLRSLEKSGAKIPPIVPEAGAAGSSGKSSILDKAKETLQNIKREGNKGFIKIPGIDNVPDPAKLAKKLSPNDFRTIQEYLNTKSAGKTAFVSPHQDMALQAVMEKLGLEKFSAKTPLFPTEQAKTSYLQTLIDHHNAQNTKGSLIVAKPTKSSFIQNKKTGKMSGSSKR